MTRLQAGSIWTNRVVQKSPETFISPDQWQMIHDAVLNQCDAKDGVKDGLIENPMACNFDTKSLLCKDGNTANCLTAVQVDALDKIAGGAKSPTTGKNFYPGWPIATKQFSGARTRQQAGRRPAERCRRYFPRPVPECELGLSHHGLRQGHRAVRQNGNTVMNAADPTKLKPLLARGGQDPVLSRLERSQHHAADQHSAIQRCGRGHGGLGKTYDEMRLFMVPGMGHCGGGDGPNTFDKLDVISDWVEKRQRA